VNGDLPRSRVDVSGGELAYAELGEGPPVLLVHGFPTSAFLWRRDAPLLASRFRVVAPDLLGYGESEKPPGADLSVLAQARYVGELLDRLGVEELAVVGHDLGGAVAQLLALEGRVKAMVLMDTACFDVWPIEGVKMLQAVPAGQQTAEFVESVVRLTFDIGIGHAGRMDDAAFQAYLLPWMDDPAAFFRAVGAIDGVGLAGRDEDLAGLDLDTFIIWGEDDPFLGSELAERLGEAIPGSTVALLPGCSHFVTEDAPTTVGPMVFEYLRYRYLGEPHAHGDHGSGPVPVSLGRPPEDLQRIGLEED
jgi:2-hydroxymuconate-semialdehyde hydrolase